jgi:putative peptidoglycan lipid II flippase
MAHDGVKDSSKHSSDSLIIMLCTLASRLLGILKARAIAMVFGATGVADVINFTFNIPNNFRKLFAEGALSTAYIPVFSSSIAEEGGGIVKSGALLARMQAFQLVVSIPLVLLTWIWRIDIIRFLSDFTDSGHIILSGNLLVYFMVFLGTISFAALYGGLLQSHGSFFLAAAAPLIFSISVIASVYGLSRYIGAYSMAFGVVFGGSVQALVTFLGLKRFGYRFTLSFDFTSSDFHRVMHTWAPVTITAVIAIITQQVSFYFASTLEEGTVTAFSNAIIIWQAPYGIFYNAIATVFFPAMVRAFATGKGKELDQLVHKGLLDIATLLVPAAILLTTLRFETTAVLLQSGRFLLSDTVNTGGVLLWFTVGMPVVAWYGFLQRVCYSTNHFKSTLVVGIIVSIVDIAIMFFGIRMGYGAASLSLANTVSFAIGTVVLWVVSRAKAKVEIGIGKLVVNLIRLLIANIPLITLAIIYLRYFNASWWTDGSNIGNLLILVGLYVAAMGITIVSYRLAGIEFIQVLFRRRRR